MELPLQQMGPELLELPRGGFNPCFNGTTSATMEQNGKALYGDHVSILVLMELPLQLWNSSKYWDLRLGFNPCFNGTTSATSYN